MKKYFIFFSLFFVMQSLVAQNNTLLKIECVAFYNLENLFDTIVDPNPERVLQKDFTPEGPKQWNTEKYYKKLDNMARVLSEIGNKVRGGAAVIGVSEVENRLVLEDLVKRPALKSRHYSIIHYDSPDERGIDVALLYRPDKFHVEGSKTFSILLPENNRTRDLLLVYGKLDGEKFYFMVDHWPSRGGGQKKSEPLRDSVAAHDRKVIDSILADDPKAKIVFMGDLNDDPKNNSVKKYLNAGKDKEKLEPKQLYNTMYEKYKKGIGSLAYNDAWNLFDQIIISQALVNGDESTYQFHSSWVFNKKYLISKEGKYKGYPFRTYGGGEYLGGYSDHLPTYIYLKKTIK